MLLVFGFSKTICLFWKNHKHISLMLYANIWRRSCMRWECFLMCLQCISFPFHLFIPFLILCCLHIFWINSYLKNARGKHWMSKEGFYYSLTALKYKLGLPEITSYVFFKMSPWMYREFMLSLVVNHLSSQWTH